MANMDSEKYSLRQRQKRKHILTNSSLDSQGYASDNSTESLNNSRDSTQYCRASKNSQATSGATAGSKSKTKAAPLSKYRRKTANARERTRMREINTAFETLRTCVPPCITNEDSGCTNEKLTKITTLRLAMKYIGLLTEALENPNEADYDLLYECTQPRVREPLITEENLEPVVKETKEKSSKSNKNNKNTKTTKPANNSRKSSTSSTPKRSVKKQKITSTENACQTSPIPNNYQESPASNASSAYASLSSASESSASPISNSSYMFEQSVANHHFTYSHPQHHNSMSDLSNLMLESDGESLNLSERCLSPLQTTNNTSNTRNEPYECSPTEMQTLENPLELSLRLMEPAADSLSLSVDPIIPPSSCISPLMNLEPFNAFDLFHTEFNEQSALDLFLT
ncbi:helix-loop-helix protein delilah [Lucilia sericata]|uniref:helix-loop-helix protein delilah n=1 Tax=Lucilia sericata TaxID=13632 RepID=UPI0018A863F4|nr:helix-loop-helix protein delilah [Lucilia sericata]XP_037806398.1 helix-loop-helix protein delilah [Lucilia sericata]